MAQNTEQIINELEGLVQFITCPSYIKDALACIKELQAHNENLQKENKYLRESLADEREHKNDMRAENKKLFDEAGNQSVLWKQHFESLYETAKETVKADTVKKLRHKIITQIQSYRLMRLLPSFGLFYQIITETTEELLSKDEREGER